MKPPFAYYGGKGRLAPWVAELLPPHRTYVEPFCGSTAVLFAKRPSVHEVINDLDGNVVNFLRQLRDRPDHLERVCRLTPYARDEYEAAQAALYDGDPDPLERARLWWVLSSQGFNKAAFRSNGWSVSTACGNGEARSVQNRIDRWADIAHRLTGVIIENRDARDIIVAHDTPETVHYCDPPYVAEARDAGSAYVQEMLTPEAHRALAEVLNDAKGCVVLSGYPSALYDELYDGWHTTERRVVRRVSNRASAKQPHALEVLWSNRPLDEGRLLLGFVVSQRVVDVPTGEAL